MDFLEYLLVGLLGGCGYGALEILWRGETHWTMLFAGWLCFFLIYRIAALRGPGLIRKALLCALAVTLSELLIGCAVNLLLGWQVWDYSDRPFDVLGQVCPEYSLLWLLLSLPLLGLSSLLQRGFASRRS